MIISLATGESIDDQIAKAREMQRNINIHIGMLIVQKVAMERGTANSCVSVKPSGYGYASLHIDPNAAARLHQFLNGIGLQGLVAPSDMHTTLMYDVSNPELKVTHAPAAHKVKIKGVKRLGDPGSKWEALVLELDAPTLTQRHKELLAAGYTYSYPEYTPHISIRYQPKASDFDTVAKKIDSLVEYMGKFDLLDEKWEHLNGD